MTRGRCPWTPAHWTSPRRRCAFSARTPTRARPWRRATSRGARASSSPPWCAHTHPRLLGVALVPACPHAHARPRPLALALAFCSPFSPPGKSKSKRESERRPLQHHVACQLELQQRHALLCPSGGAGRGAATREGAPGAGLRHDALQQLQQDGCGRGAGVSHKIDLCLLAHFSSPLLTHSHVLPPARG